MSEPKYRVGQRVRVSGTAMWCASEAGVVLEVTPTTSLSGSRFIYVLGMENSGSPYAFQEEELEPITTRDDSEGGDAATATDPPGSGAIRRLQVGSEEKATADTANEVRHSDPETGAQKGRKPEEYALLPVGSLAEVARVYGFGATKYADHNWRKGYPFSWSYSALQRHVNAFWGGEDKDPESGLSHLAHAAFHLFALMEFQKTHPEKDDRYAD